MLGDGATFSLMVGLGESFVPAYVLALGMGEVAAGLVTSLPMLAGALMQLISPWAVARLGSHRRWVVACALCQAGSLLLLPISGLADGRLGWLVFVATTIYWATGLATGPVWNTWVEALVPRPIRARFFAARTRICHAGVLVGFLLGGVVLHKGAAIATPLQQFSLLFLLAGACRFLSAAFLSRQSEPALLGASSTAGASTGGSLPHVGLVQLWGELRGHAGARLLAYLLAVQTGVWMAAPFFTPYMLAQLHLSYGQYVWLIASSVVSRIAVLPLLGRYAHNSGARRLLWAGGLAITPLSAFWLVSDSVAYLTGLQLVAGVAWGAYELGMFLMFFETIPRHERTSLLTIYNAGNALAMVTGSLVGAVLLKLLGEVVTSYLVLFALSAVTRGLALVLLLRVPEVAFQAVRPATRTLAVRPEEGAFEAPILPSIPNGEVGQEGAEILS